VTDVPAGRKAQAGARDGTIGPLFMAATRAPPIWLEDTRGPLPLTRPQEEGAPVGSTPRTRLSDRDSSGICLAVGGSA
jgi:hypothetical protein